LSLSFEQRKGEAIMVNQAMSETELIRLEDRRYEAMLARDVAALRDIFADDAVYTHSNGVVDDKAAYLKAFSSGEFIYRTIERFEEKVRVLGDAAVVTGRIRLKVDFKSGPKLLESRFLSAWVRTAEGWRHLAWQSTPPPSHAPAAGARAQAI
jgi:ketosteroid isomerase-like protein